MDVAAFCYGGRAAATKWLPQGSAFPYYSMCALLLGYYSAAINSSRPRRRLHGLARSSCGGTSAATPRHASAWQDQEIRACMRLEPWPPPDHHSSRASCLRRREEMLWVESTVHIVNSNGSRILGKIRLDWFVISLNLEIGILRVKSAHLYKDGIVSLLIKQ